MIKRLIFVIFICVCASAFSQVEELPVKVINGVPYYYYEAPAKATIYSITRKYGISREDLFKYNPQVIDGLRAGDVLLFPVNKVEQEAEEEPAVAEEEPVVVEEEADEVIEEEIAAVPTDTVVSKLEESINVGIMLPFMLEMEGTTRQAQNQTDFYRGALLAVNKLASADNQLSVYAFDTENDVAKLRDILTRPEIQMLDYIIVPGDTLSIETVAALADSTDAVVVNLFGVKNDAYLHHESVFQANIPHDAMYTRAQEAFCKEYKGYKVLIVNATDIPADKRTFTDELTASLVRNGIPYEQIDYSGKLQIEQLTALPSRDYVIVPTSGSREALMKVLPTLTEFAEANPANDVRLFGYPEWVVLRGDIKDKLHKLGATVYSRFSTDLDGEDVATVNGEYKHWYGEEPQPSLPDVMLLGYDTIAWILNSAEKGRDVPYVGLQNSFKVTNLEDAGSVNDALYFITFTRTGRVDARSL